MYLEADYEMSKSAREALDDIAEEMDLMEEIIGDQEIELEEKNQYIEQLTSSRWYVDVVVAILFAYVYGAWFGVYMCSK